MRWIVPALVCLAVVSCASPEVVPVSVDTYQIFKEVRVIGWQNLARLKAGVYAEASRFAVEQGKDLVVLSEKEYSQGFGHLASFHLTFKLVPPAAKPAAPPVRQP